MPTTHAVVVDFGFTLCSELLLCGAGPGDDGGMDERLPEHQSGFQVP